MPNCCSHISGAMQYESSLPPSSNTESLQGGPGCHLHPEQERHKYSALAKASGTLTLAVYVCMCAYNPYRHVYMHTYMHACLCMYALSSSVTQSAETTNRPKVSYAVQGRRRSRHRHWGLACRNVRSHRTAKVSCKLLGLQRGLHELNGWASFFSGNSGFKSCATPLSDQ